MNNIPKVVLLGDTMVGKTAIAKRLYDDSFESISKPTIGMGNMIIEKRIDGIFIRFNLFDTAGQEKYKSLTPMYFQNADLILLVYDTTEEDSFHALESWHKMVEQRGPESVSFVIVGNKCDKKEALVLANGKTLNYAANIGATLFIVSAKTGEGFDNLLIGINESLKDNLKNTDAGVFIENNKSSKAPICCF